MASDVFGRVRTAETKYGTVIITPDTHHHLTKFTVPEGVDTITVNAVGGGGGSGIANEHRGDYFTADGAAGGAHIQVTFTEIAPGTVIAFTVGAGGATANQTNVSSPGGDTTFLFEGVGYTAGGGCGCMGPDGAGTTGGTAGLAEAAGSAYSPTLVHGNTGHESRLTADGGCGGVALYLGYGYGGSGGNNAVRMGNKGGDGVVIIT